MRRAFAIFRRDTGFTISQRDTGFTIIEMLVVLAVVATIAGLALTVNRGEDREAAVKAAANELAATLRETRERAIRERGVYAIVFNIENAPGSSGRILNNRSGGHWYRVIGPKPGQQGWGDQVSFVPFFARGSSGIAGMSAGPGQFQDNPIRLFLEQVDQAWIEDPHQLPKKKVRFVALNDQDNGSFRKPRDTYPATYPRPWCGWWDQATGRLHTWGGYDADLAMMSQTGDSNGRHKARTTGGHSISHSGFFYEGYDGPITGCLHPTDRLVFDDTNGDGRIVLDPGEPARSDDPAKLYPLWRAGEPRSLVNARWQDYMILFNPDGTVWTSWMKLRHEYAKEYDETDVLFYDGALDGNDADAPVAAGHYSLKRLAPFDLCNRVSGKYAEEYPNPDKVQLEASSFARRSGFDFITLGPDMPDDRDTFRDAQEVIKSLTPLYRVGISRYGEVQVIRVRNANYGGKTYDPTITGTAWNTKSTTDAFYQKGVLTNADGTPRGEPITDVVTRQMLTERMWWWQ